MMTDKELIATIADHYGKLFLYNLGTLVFIAIGVVIYVNAKIAKVFVFELDDAVCDKLLTELLVTHEDITKFNAVVTVLNKAGTNKRLDFELADPTTFQRIDEIVNNKMLKFVEKGQEKWAYR